MNKINQSKFTIVSNGYADGPSQALRDFLVSHKAVNVTTVEHPLVAGGDNTHIIKHYQGGKVSEKRFKFLNKPPYTYVFDSFIPLRLPSSEMVWFGFNNLACLRGILRRKMGRTNTVVYWAVDFVPNRFGTGFATKVYNAVDRFVCKHADMRVELTPEALEQRAKYLNLSPEIAERSMVIPMGAWLARTPKVSAEAFEKKKIIYMGHIVERQGVKNLIHAMSILVKEDANITLDIVGGGPDESKMKTLAEELKLTDHITFRGFVDDHKDLEGYLALGTVATAPYAKIPDNFSVTSDPGKVKAYLGASLPMVLTDVPPIAKVLEARGAALLCDDTPESIAENIAQYLNDKKKWSHAHTASAKLAKEYDWESILSAKLEKIGLR